MEDWVADAQVSAAIDHVLQFESAARAAVAACEREFMQSVEGARDQRRAILNRAQQRIVRLHAHCTEVLERRLAAAAEEHGKKAAAILAKLTDPARRQRALETLAATLTTPQEARDDAP